MPIHNSLKRAFFVLKSHELSLLYEVFIVNHEKITLRTLLKLYGVFRFLGLDYLLCSV